MVSPSSIGAYEGDLIRPLGFVTLYAAYAEGELDELLVALAGQQPLTKKQQQWTLGKKLKRAQELALQLNAEALSPLLETLKEARVLFDRRNALIHGRLYAGGHLVSNRRDVPNQQVTPEEIGELADLIFTCKEWMSVHRCRLVLPLFARKQRGRVGV